MPVDAPVGAGPCFCTGVTLQAVMASTGVDFSTLYCRRSTYSRHIKRLHSVIYRYHTQYAVMFFFCYLSGWPQRKRKKFPEFSRLFQSHKRSLSHQKVTRQLATTVSEGNRRSLRSSSDNVCGATYAQQLWRQKLWRCRSANLEQSAVWPANT